jgi:hypothetical protein
MSSKQCMHHISNYGPKETTFCVTLTKALSLKAIPVVWEQDDIMSVLRLLKFLL